MTKTTALPRRRISPFLAVPVAIVCLVAPIAQAKQAGATPSDKIDKIVSLIEAEDWSAASDLAVKCLADLEAGTDEEMKARMRYIVIYTSAGAVSIEKLSYDAMEQRLKPLVGKQLVTAYRPISSKCPGGAMNAICANGGTEASTMVVAANKTNTTIFAFEYVAFKTPVELAKLDGKWATVKGTLQKIEPNPNKSLALILRVWLTDVVLEIPADQA